MAVIVQKGHPALRQKARPVELAEIGSPRMKRVLADMQEALEREDDGVALAAPQIGVPLRLFIVSKAALRSGVRTRLRETRGGPAAREPRGAEAENVEPENIAQLKRAAGYLVFVNPVIRKLSREKAVVDEGCLSVRPFYGKIKRAKKATITACDESGKRFTRGASGLLAQIFQHETDHLDGVLFIDKATDLKAMPRERDKTGQSILNP